MHFLAENVGRDHGNGTVSESFLPVFSNCGFSSSTTKLRNAFTKVFIVTYEATLLLIAFTIVRDFKLLRTKLDFLGQRRRKHAYSEPRKVKSSPISKKAD